MRRKTTKYILDAVCCGNDPAVVEHDATAIKGSILFEHDLPRPGTTCCRLTIDDVWTDVCDVWWPLTTVWVCVKTYNAAFKLEWIAPFNSTWRQFCCQRRPLIKPGFHPNAIACVACVASVAFGWKPGLDGNRAKRKRLRWQAVNHGWHCFDRAFLSKRYAHNARNASDCVWIETGL